MQYVVGSHFWQTLCWLLLNSNFPYYLAEMKVQLIWWYTVAVRLYTVMVLASEVNEQVVLSVLKAKRRCNIWLGDSQSCFYLLLTLPSCILLSTYIKVWHYWAYCTMSTTFHSSGQIDGVCPHTWHCRWLPAVLALTADARTVCLPVPSQIPILQALWWFCI